MNHKKPPKRIIKSISLTDAENQRFIKVVQELGYLERIEHFIKETGMYLRGRCDGATESNTEACGYIFLNKDSFEKCHRQIAYFDPYPSSEPLKLSFRRWNKVLPFDEEIWVNQLDDDDRLQANMRIKYIQNFNDLQVAIELSNLARETFSNTFDLSIDRNQ